MLQQVDTIGLVAFTVVVDVSNVVVVCNTVVGQIDRSTPIVQEAILVCLPTNERLTIR